MLKHEQNLAIKRMIISSGLFLLCGLLLIGSIRMGSREAVVAYAQDFATPTPTNPDLIHTVQSLVSDEDCVLPCWWDFTLGDDILTDTEKRLFDYFAQNPIKRVYKNYTEVEVYLNTGDTGIQEDETAGYSPFSLWTRNTDEKAVAASLSLDSPRDSYVDWSPYLPASILGSYGVPDEVTISYPLNGASQSGYHLGIRYFEKGIFVSYLMVYLTHEGEIDESTGIPICNFLEDVSTFKIWIQIEELDADNIGMFWDGLRSKQPYEYLIEDISTYDTETFTEVFSEPNTCIYTLPYDEWVRSE